MNWGGHGQTEGYWDTAQICVNGHVVTDTLEFSPERAEKRCHECGGETISQCPSCSVAIRGYHHVPGIIIAGGYERPAFCHECGKPFPWTAAGLEAARELAREAVTLNA